MKSLFRATNSLGKYFSTVVVSVASLFRYSGELIIQIIIAGQFGAGKEVDAYFAAWLIPSVIVFMLSQTLHNVFLPTFVSKKQQDGEKEAWRLISSLSNTILLVLLVFTIFAPLTADWWLDLVMPGLNIETKLIANKLVWILFPMIILNAIISILDAISFSYEYFLKSSLSVIIRTIIYVFIAIMFTNIFGIYGLAIAVMVGLSANIIMLTYLMRQKIALYKFKINWKSSEYLPHIKLWGSFLILALIFRLSPIIERYFASLLGEGAISHISYAATLINIITVLTAGSIGIVLFSSLANAVAAKDFSKVADTLSRSFSAAIFISFPFFVIVLMFGQEIVRIVFERGEFTSQDTVIVGTTMVFYLGVLLGSLVTSITSNVLYANRSIRFLAFQAFFTVSIQIIFTIVALPQIGIYGVALAKSVSMVGSAILHLIYLQRTTEYLLSSLMDQLANVFRILISGIILILITWLGKGVYDFINPTQILNQIFLLGIVGFTGIIGYISCSALFKVNETTLLFSRIAGFR